MYVLYAAENLNPDEKCRAVTPFYSLFIIFNDSRGPGSLFCSVTEPQSQGMRVGFLASVESFAGGCELSVNFPALRGTFCYRSSFVFFS